MNVRKVLKAMLSGICICVVAPLALCECAARMTVGRDVWFHFQAELISLIPGKIGSYVRNAYYWITLKNCPLDCSLQFGSFFTHSGAIVGHRIYIGSHSMIGLVTLGDDTILGDHVHILSGKHQHSFDDPSRRIQDQPQQFVMIHVGANCWIGTNTVAMENIGNNCVIGASSVVTHPISDNMIAVGNPASILRARPASELTKLTVTISDD